MRSKTQEQELALARLYAPAPPFEGLTEEQVNLIMIRGRSLYKWFKAHPLLHNLVGSAVILFIFTADFFALIRAPRLLLLPHHTNPLASILMASFVAGCLHSWIMYSLNVFSLHEGAAHNIVFAGTGGLGRIGHAL